MVKKKEEEFLFLMYQVVGSIMSVYANGSKRIYKIKAEVKYLMAI